MSNEELILKGVREVYKQNQELEVLLRQALTRIEAVEKSVGTVVPTAKSNSDAKPWEKWTNKTPEDDIPQTVKDTFKL